MTSCLNDLSYILPNNEQNELTQGDIGETSNEPTQAIRNEFEELYASANEERSFMLMLLIPGPKSLGNNIDVHLRPFIDDLKDLWAKKGVETIDVATGQKFNMRAMVLQTINDFPTRSSLSGWSGQGYKACPTCNEDTLSTHMLGKTTYVGHKRFLKSPINEGGHVISMVNSKMEILIENLTGMTSWLNLLDCSHV
ncbi:hypothetical protein Tco_1476548 [Tanacetum coccineum]